MGTTGFDTLLVDLGGVLQTDAWDARVRRAAAERFGISFEEMNGRHEDAFDSFERGHLTFAGYLDLVVFHTRRDFTRDDFAAYVLGYVEPYQEMIDFLLELRSRHRLKVMLLSNEGREMFEYRIRKYPMDGLVDALLVSYMTGLRKPDPEFFRLALDVAATEAGKTAYIDNLPVNVEAARTLGIRSILHEDLVGSKRALEELGLQ